MHARLGQAFNGGDMPARKVYHVDIVTNARAVRRRIVVAEHADLLKLAARDLRHVGHEVVRDPLGVLTDAPARMCPVGIEVPQEGNVPRIVGAVKIRQDRLDLVFGRAVGVGRPARLAGFGQRQYLRRAVHRRGGGEDQLLDPVCAHDFEQHQRAVNVVVVVFQRFHTTFADRFEPREMNHGVKVVLTENGFHGIAVTDIRTIETEVLPREFPHAVRGNLRCVREVIHHGDPIAAVQQFHQCVAADKADTTRKQNVFHVFIPPLSVVKPA